MEKDIDALFHNIVQIPKEGVCDFDTFQFTGKNFSVDINVFKEFLNKDLTEEQKVYFVKRFLFIEKSRLNILLDTLESQGNYKNSDLLTLIAIANKEINSDKYYVFEDIKKETIIDKILNFCNIIMHGYYIPDTRVTMNVCIKLDEMGILKDIFFGDTKILFESFKVLYDDETCKEIIEKSINKSPTSFLINRLRQIFEDLYHEQLLEDLDRIKEDIKVKL